ncbi:MAG: winged helix-turn-helix domain-containing protein [Rhodobacter sp.]|nr:winged helix-turn-helix domain-containing protein [Rhodobacter sp.]
MALLATLMRSAMAVLAKRLKRTADVRGADIFIMISIWFDGSIIGCASDIMLERDWVVSGGFLEVRDLNGTPAQIWRFGSFVFNEATSELSRNGKAVPIEPQSLLLLGYLIRHRDRVVSREDLVDAIWQGRAVSDWAISGAIKALRVALGDTEAERQFVRTIHSRGYRFVAQATSTPPEGQPQKPPMILVRIFRMPHQENGLEYLAEGLAEDLITGLSGRPSWRVLSYNTARALAESVPSAEYGVTTIIDGSIRQSADTIRINVSVLDGSGTQQAWAESFDLTPNSLLAGHDMICERLIAVLSPGEPARRSRQRGTLDPAAYDHYQKGRYAYFRYEPKAFIAALDNFTKATEIDPTYANAYAQQAYCRTTLYVFGLPGADKTLDAAEALARKAIEIDGESALGHARLGWVLGYCGKPAETIAAFETALRFDPDNAEVYHAYGETMNRLAQPQKAAPLLETVFSKDSYFPPSWEFPQGHTEILLGHHDRAIEHFNSVLDRLERFIPARVQLVRTLWETGNKTDARQNVAAIRTFAPNYSLAHVARMFPYPDKVEKARLINALADAGLG